MPALPPEPVYITVPPRGSLPAAFNETSIETAMELLIAEGKDYGDAGSVWQATRMKMGKDSMELSDEDFYARYNTTQAPAKAEIGVWFVQFKKNMPARAKNSGKKYRYIRNLCAHARKYPEDRAQVAEALTDIGRADKITW